MATISNHGTTKQKPRLDYNGYSYVKDRTTNEKIYWRCIKYSSHHCHSRLHTCIITNNIIKPPTEHTCKFDDTTVELRNFDEKIIDRACNTQETPDIIISNCFRGMPDEGITRLPTRENIKRRIRKLRYNNDFISPPNAANFISIPTILCKTLRQAQFLRCDTGPGDDRIIIFSSDEQINILQSTHHFLADGTFKDTGTYRRLINEILKIAPQWTPHSIMIGFEMACINVHEEIFPNIAVSGCYFHLQQNLYRKLQDLGWQNRYQTDSIFAHNIHKFGALVFLEINNVIKGFESLSMDLDEDYQEMIDYFEETYIGRLRPNHTRRKATFDIHLWNMHSRTSTSSMRTNNSAEAYHRRTGSVFQCAHPTLWVFLQKLIDEENVTHADILQINAGQPPKMKKKNQRFEKRLLHLISTPHSDILIQIDSIAHNISL
ncbi:unnamed protein product [Rotaria sordida]|uniref:FLYWCH-type domain-containing protein n=1 Tax=Rotaria sordida TaxID=392033 RepID=A0A813V8J1_9BILA|nr:unnamed protein product [Rotaria sordida]CAF3849510.1 unnamed protein product [Rotaria sordida]